MNKIIQSTIPRIVHYVWVGPNKMSALQTRCIDSWIRFLPNYKLRFWNEQTISQEVMRHSFVRAMYAQKKWAFVSDYIRFWALEREGGIYLDTDIEVLKSFDPLLCESGFVGRSKSGHIESAIIGARRGADFIKEALQFYDNNRDYTTKNTSPIVLQSAIISNKNAKIIVYPPEYFYPCDDGERCSSEKLASAYAVHHWTESWVSHAKLRKFLRRVGFMNVLKKIFRKKIYCLL